MLLKFLQRGFSIFLFGFFLFFVCFSETFAHDIAEREITLNRYGYELYSPVIEEPADFYSIGIQSQEVIEGLMVNFDPLNGGVWEPVADYAFDEWPLFTSPTHMVRFKKKAEGDESRMSFNAHFFFSEEDDEEALYTENYYGGPEVAAADFRLISRHEWGADENLRYWSPETEELLRGDRSEKDYVNVCAGMEEKYASEVRLSRTVQSGPNGESLIWPLAYPQTVQKFIIHHTASELKDLNGDSRLDGRDYMAMLRAIYYYHAITRGWGDIGYNYIIDPLGNVYQGRYGGERVIGAHAQCYNNGSIGISVIGNYSDKTISEPAFNALVALIAEKAKLYNIDPEGSSVFRGKKLPNILGHRDVGNTSCPGEHFYQMFDKIRQRAGLAVRSGIFKENTIDTQTLDYNAEALSDVSVVSLEPNERKKITLRFKNTGQKTWDGNTWLHVALNNRENARVVPIIEDKAFVAADLHEPSVSPGGVGTFEVELEAGYEPVNYTFEVAPVANGRYKISRSAVFIPIEVQEPRFSYRVVSDKDLPGGILFQGQKIQGSIKIQNTGNVSWFNYGQHPIRLGTENLRDRRSLLVKQHTTRIAHLLESEVKPGETGTFLFNLEGPLNYEGRIAESFSPVIEGVQWLENKGLGFELVIKKPRHLARIAEKTKIPSMLPGEMRKITLTMENRGDLAWDQENMQVRLLGTGIKVFKSKMVPAKPVAPQKTVQFDFWVQAPYEEGRHRVFLRSTFNGVGIQGGTARFLIDVESPRLRAQMTDQTSRTVTLKPGQEKEIEVKFKNLGNTAWQNKGENAIYLGTSNPQDRLSRLYYEDGWVNKYRAGKMVEGTVMPGEVGTFRFKVKPDRAGIYREYFQLVVERVGWIGGSDVRWDFRVSGNAVSTSSDSAAKNQDAIQNKEQAVILTNIRSNTITNTTSTTNTTTPKAVPVAQPVPQTVTPSSSDDLFRVRISYGDDYSKVTANTLFRIVNEKNEILFEVGAGTAADIRHLQGSVHVQVGPNTKTAQWIRVIPADNGIVEILTMDRPPSWNRDLNDNRFRGVMEIRPIGGETAFIDELPLEDYLKGLAEVSNGDLYEKQKTIAILARTYARFYMDDSNRKFPGMPYDGSDDPAIFQRYLGYGYEIRSPNFVAAVAATKNKVVTYEGTLIKTPYFNQSDGRTRSAYEVWGWTNTPYLQSTPDPYCEGLILRGHGVGLSGYGAEAMAGEGKTYDEIIKYYYQGVKIEQLDF
ncbi:N-acetylmuramoyl-L-alanine amidase [Candidatus Peregrinibacteria bacterium]|nr:N-acetylmuramoyl-L-alanine amidase [Candidatus Peregrinibacteria bacterium]